MSHYYTDGYGSGRAHRYHVRRRLEKKISTLLLVVGPFCVLLSIIIFAVSFTYSPATQHRWRKMSLVYVAAGICLLGARWVAGLVGNRPSSFYRPRLRGGNGVPNGDDQTPPESAGQDGAVLVMVLIVVALIGGLVLEAQTAARYALRREQQALIQTRLRQAAADAAYAALRRLADDQDLRVDYTNEAWAVVEELKDPAGVDTRVKVTDENRYFNLNNLAVDAASAGARPATDIVMDLMTLCGDFTPVGRVDSLVSWLDADDEGYAESRLYRERAPPYEAANRIAYAWSELLWVNGFDRGYFARHERMTRSEIFNADLVDCVTVAPVAQNSVFPVNINTAGADVLLGVLGMHRDDVVRTILAARAEEPIRSLEPFFAAADPVVAETARAYLSVRSQVFTVDAQAYAEGQSERLRVMARRGQEGDVDVLQWAY